MYSNTSFRTKETVKKLTWNQLQLTMKLVFHFTQSAQSQFSLRQFRSLNKKRNANVGIVFENLISNVVCERARFLFYLFFLFSWAAMISKGVCILSLFGRTWLEGWVFTWIFRGFHPPRTAPIGFSVRPMLFNRSAWGGVESMYFIHYYLFFY